MHIVDSNPTSGTTPQLDHFATLLFNDANREGWQSEARFRMNEIVSDNYIKHAFSFDKRNVDWKDFILYCGYDNLHYYADQLLVDREAQLYFQEYDAQYKACRTGEDTPVQGGGKYTDPRL